MQSVNPASGEIIRHYHEKSANEIAGILSNCGQVQQSWAKSAYSIRQDCMKQAAVMLRKDKESLARLITIEMGKIIRESRAEIEKCAWVCEYYADHAEKMLADEIMESDASRSFVSFEPLGVVLAVMPWNFPFWQVFRFAAPALMAGNGAVLKHASNVPGCALAIENIFQEAGFPTNLFRSLLIKSHLVEKVVAHPAVQAVTLTGSELAGKAVAALAGKYLKKTVLELGGSDPFIILSDADIEACIPVSVQARMLNAGQSCIAAKRFIVEQSVLREFEEKHTAAVRNLNYGDPMQEETDIGPLARPEFVEEIDRQVQESIRSGARLLTGGQKMKGNGYYYQPTVLSNVTPEMPVFRQETFGPVSVIIPAKDENEAVKLANNSDFGLGGSLWSDDIERANRLARDISTGAVFINGMTKSDPRLPFGGIKNSGYGRELSHYGIKEFVNMKTIWIG